MKHYSLAILSVMVCVALLFHQSQNKVTAAPKDDQQIIGTVDLGKVIQECKASKEREEAQMAQAKTIEEKLQTLAKEVEGIEEQLRTAIKPNTQEYDTLRQDFFNKRANLEAFEKSQTMLFDSRNQDWLQLLYQIILTEVNKVALEKHIDLVVKKEQPNLRARSPKELSSLIRTQSILYSADSIDITALIIERVDQLHAKGK